MGNRQFMMFEFPAIFDIKDLLTKFANSFKGKFIAQLAKALPW